MPNNETRTTRAAPEQALDRDWRPDDVKEVVTRIRNPQSGENKMYVTNRLKMRDNRDRTVLHAATGHGASYEDSLRPVLTFIVNEVSQPGT